MATLLWPKGVSNPDWRLFVVLLLLMSIVQALRSYIDTQVTLGDLLAVVSPILMAIVVASVGAWRRRHPFSFLFPDQPIDISLDDELRGRTYRRSKTLFEGNSTLAVEVRSKVATAVTPFDIRFVEWRGFRRRSVSPGKLYISTASIPQWEEQTRVDRDAAGANHPDVQGNSVGGITVRTRLPKLLVSGERLMIELHVRASGTWKGYLSFRANAEGRRAFCRRRIEVIGVEPTGAGPPNQESDV